MAATEISYGKLLDKIAKSSGLNREEIERRVEAKRAKLSGLISYEGAAQVVAAELGISFDNEKMKIEELISGMRKANVLAKVIKLFPVRTFVKNGKEGKVANLIVGDETSNMKVVLWDTNHIELIENGSLREEVVVEIKNASVRGNELHLGSFSDLKITKEVIDNVKKDKIFREKNISDFKLSDNVSVRAFVVQAFEPKIFNVCPECKKKAILENEHYVCIEHGKVSPERRILMNLVVDDGTETIRTVMFNDSLKQIGIDSENFSHITEKKQELLGREMVFSGDVRLNKFFNNPEFVVEKVEEPKLDLLLQELEKSEKLE